MKRSILAVGIATGLIAGSASAADQQRLVELLTPIYAAAQFTAVCGAGVPGFFQMTRGRMGSSLVYMQHVKEEVAADLEPGNAQVVLVKAADAAREMARAQLRALERASKEETKIEVEHWCRTYARLFAMKANRAHDAKHREFLAALAGAKKH